ncbi:MAG: AbrB/MazE/SpoVT family DNA-binding domain-containing protein [Thermoplasmata archaeon]|nr:AbrB/MazE/SpoVT family DNA-binding domain-containing protein [Thermoplasmata archaeon]
MKLQKQFSKKIDERFFPKYSVADSYCTIETMNLKEGTDLEVIVKDGKIILRPKQ